jgi:phage I-like protein
MNRRPKVSTEVLDGVELSSEPPTEILLFANGTTSTKKGDFIFDEDSADSVRESLAADGRDKLPFDIAHGMLSGNDAGRHKAVGWFTPTIKDDGTGVALFASDIEWTSETAESIRNREYRFHSPAIRYESKSRRITGLINVALTNIPATNNQTPIVLDSGETDGDEAPQKENNHMKLQALLGVSEEKIEETVEALHADHAALVDKHAQLQTSLEEAKAELTAIKVASAKAERKAKIEKLSSEGKLAPSQHDFAAELSNELFESFVATLTVQVSSEETVEQPKKTIKLSDVEKKMCEELMISPEDFLAQKESN